MRVGEQTGGLGALRTAFEALSAPEQHVLWLTQVEGLAPWEAAERLGLTTDELGRLAFTARSALRRRLAASQLDGLEIPACRAAVNHLPVHALGALPDELRKSVESHLRRCADCAARFAVVADCSTHLRRTTVPQPTALPPASRRHNAAIVALPAHGTTARRRRVAWQRVAVGASAALLGVAGMAAVLARNGTRDEPLALSDPFVPDAPGRAPEVLGERVERRIVPTVTLAVPDAGDDAPAPAAPPATTPPPPAVAAVSPPPTTVPSLPETDPLQVDVDAGVLEVAVGLGEESCTGVRVLTITLGCTEPADSPDVGVSVPSLLGLLGGE